MYSANVLADSISRNHRLITLQVTFPRFILAEVNTHRVFSRNSASSRAIPPEKIIQKVNTHPFIPETFNKRVKGMGVGPALEDRDAVVCRDAWLDALNYAVRQATILLERGVDKSRINRLLEPFMWHTAIISGTDWENFFALRLHPDAQPEFRILATHMLNAIEASTPNPLPIGQWHVPLISYDELKQVRDGGLTWTHIAMASAGRCARVSYDRHEEAEDLEKSHARAVNLQEAGHMSPLEHPATPLRAALRGGNFQGWQQLRKLIPNEANLIGIQRGRQFVTEQK